MSNAQPDLRWHVRSDVLHPSKASSHRWLIQAVREAQALRRQAALELQESPHFDQVIVIEGTILDEQITLSLRIFPEG